MKKSILAVVLGVALSTTAVFADHPSGFGIGAMGTWGLGSAAGGWGGALSLKIPDIPLFWGVSPGLGVNYFAVGVRGDYYMIDKLLAPEAKLHWYMGLGGFFDFYNYSIASRYSGEKKDSSYAYTDFGARVPIGLSFQPANFLEIFLEVAPSFGVGINSGWEVKHTSGYTEKSPGSMVPYWALPFSLGFRLWFY